MSTQAAFTSAAFAERSRTSHIYYALYHIPAYYMYYTVCMNILKDDIHLHRSSVFFMYPRDHLVLQTPKTAPAHFEGSCP